MEKTDLRVGSDEPEGVLQRVEDPNSRVDIVFGFELSVAPPKAVQLISDRTLRQLDNPDIGVQRKPSAPRLR